MPLASGDEQRQRLLPLLDRQVQLGGQPAARASEAVVVGLGVDAAGRLLLRSYGMDLLRWYRFLWALEVHWDQATRAEARDFCRWLQLADKPVRVHWRDQRKGITAP
ncbi:hypothetical protein SAV14893_096610 [Streptomyces avermitilis]|nr:hypothetical protein [Streptomyces avermitilis]GDY70268.1 hypothetical protein SAV14893_096610 [Streptomyces avermitilis]